MASWLISEPFVRTAARDGIRVGNSSFTLGSFYGWFAHALLGAFIVGPIAIFVNWGRNRPAKAVLLSLMAVVLGAAFTAGADAGSDWTSIHLLRSGAPSTPLITVLWNLSVAFAMSIALFLSTSPTVARLQRALIAGFAAGVAGFICRMALLPVMVFILIMRGSTGAGSGWIPFDPSRLLDDAAMGFIIGAAIAVSDQLNSPARARLKLGRNEFRDFNLASGFNRLGRAEGIEIPIFDPALDPVQAIVTWDGRQFEVRNLSPRSMMKVCGQPLEVAYVPNGASFEIGAHEVQLLADRAPRAASFSQPQWVQNPAPVPLKQPILRHVLVDAFGAIIPLREGTNRIGREVGVEVSLANDQTLSRNHAVIIVSPDGKAVLKDVGSTNGTWLNGERLAAEYRNLNNGDTLKFGNAVLTYRVDFQ